MSTRERKKNIDERQKKLQKKQKIEKGEKKYTIKENIASGNL